MNASDNRDYALTEPAPQLSQMDLDHFVCACVVVRQMCDLYDKCSMGGLGPGQTQISRDDFLQAVISLP